MATARQNHDFVSSLLPQYPLDEAVDWIARNLEPEDVFSTSKLQQWAEDNGYAKEAQGE